MAGLQSAGLERIGGLGDRHFSIVGVLERRGQADRDREVVG